MIGFIESIFAETSILDFSTVSFWVPATRRNLLTSLKKNVRHSQCFYSFSFVKVPFLVSFINFYLSHVILLGTWNKEFSFTSCKLSFYSIWYILSYLPIKIIVELIVGSSNANISYPNFTWKGGDCIILLTYYSLTRQGN